jgi:hypothetical protein
MIRKILAALAAFATIAFLPGCATLADAKAGRGTGLAREFAAPVDTVWKTIPVVLKELELPLVSENRAEGTILAQRGITALSYGENVAIFVDPAGANRTRVEIVSKKAMATNIFAPDWAQEVLDKLGQKLR